MPLLAQGGSANGPAHRQGQVANPQGTAAPDRRFPIPNSEHENPLRDSEVLISLPRAQVEAQEKPKTPKGRAHKRDLYTRRFVNITLTPGGKRKVGRNSEFGLG